VTPVYVRNALRVSLSVLPAPLHGFPLDGALKTPRKPLAAVEFEYSSLNALYPSRLIVKMPICRKFLKANGNNDNLIMYLLVERINYALHSKITQFFSLQNVNSLVCYQLSFYEPTGLFFLKKINIRFVSVKSMQLSHK